MDFAKRIATSGALDRAYRDAIVQTSNSLAAFVRGLAFKFSALDNSFIYIYRSCFFTSKSYDNVITMWKYDLMFLD